MTVTVPFNDVHLWDISVISTSVLVPNTHIPVEARIRLTLYTDVINVTPNGSDPESDGIEAAVEITVKDAQELMAVLGAAIHEARHHSKVPF